MQGILIDTHLISSESRSEAHAFAEKQSPIKFTSQPIDSKKLKIFYINTYDNLHNLNTSGRGALVNLFLFSLAISFICYCYFGISILWNGFNWQYLIYEKINKFSRVERTTIYFLWRPWNFDDFIRWCDAADKTSITFAWTPMNGLFIDVFVLNFSRGVFCTRHILSCFIINF